MGLTGINRSRSFTEKIPTCTARSKSVVSSLLKGYIWHKINIYLEKAKNIPSNTKEGKMLNIEKMHELEHIKTQVQSETIHPDEYDRWCVFQVAPTRFKQCGIPQKCSPFRPHIKEFSRVNACQIYTANPIKRMIKKKHV